MGVHIMSILKFFIYTTVFFLYTSVIAKNTIVSLDTFRESSKFKAFIGSYMPLDFYGSKGPAILTTENGFLTFRYYSAGIPVGFISVRLPLEDYENFDYQYGMYRKAIERVKYNFSEQIITQQVTIETKTKKSIEILTLDISSGLLEVKMTRKYYKRKYILTGPWVQDTTSFDGERNTLENVLTFQKYSAKPILLNDFFELSKFYQEDTVAFKDLHYDDLVAVLGKERADAFNAQINENNRDHFETSPDKLSSRESYLESQVIGRDGNVIRLKFGAVEPYLHDGINKVQLKSCAGYLAF